MVRRTSSGTSGDNVESDAFWIKVRLQVITGTAKHQSSTGRLVWKRRKRGATLTSVLARVELANMRLEPSKQFAGCRIDARDGHGDLDSPVYGLSLRLLLFL